eukprot:TRINITY_DN1261_c0_g2_i2.p1 TRINITY_DN1261_c0_g2~~TRINITY_DN1261_c0_g2_i2.p1  ORF type:complete len:348 (+),score=77.40 TRINITY_DN1261_c0_g2_i2:28-1071(+)
MGWWLLVLAIALYLFWRWTSLKSASIPHTLGLPLLGNALSWRMDPVDFLSSLKKRFGGVFMINLAGHRMIIISDPKALEDFHKADEETLSSIEATTDVGFQIVLGRDNVLHGSAIHRQILKDQMIQNKNEFVVDFDVVLGKALRIETQFHEGSVDFIPFVRKVILRATVDYYISHEISAKFPSFLDEFTTFEDELEEGIAKAAVVPRFLQRVILAPVEKKRFNLKIKVAQVVKELYLKKATTGYLRDLISTSKLNFQVEDDFGTIAEYCLGLLFAAAKNPSILCAQTFLFLLENSAQLDRAQRELEEVSAKFREGQVQVEEMKFVDTCIKETLRLTAQPSKFHRGTL